MKQAAAYLGGVFPKQSASDGKGSSTCAGSETLPTTSGRRSATRSASLAGPILAERHMVTFWTRMEEIYPHRWEAKMGPVGSSTFATWQKGLAGVTTERIADGLTGCIRRQDGWPPSLPEFRGMCLAGVAQRAAHRRYLALPTPRADAAVVRNAVGSMRLALLGRVPLSSYAALHGMRELV